MKTSIILSTALLALCTLALGCDEKKDTSPQPTITPPVVATAPRTVTLTDEDVPVAEDFIEESTAQITEENYKAQLDQLDTEISAQ